MKNHKDLSFPFSDIEFRYVYSIGCDCYTAISLVRAGHREYSGPLDWIRGSSFRTRMKLVMTDFDTLLDRQHLVVKNDIVWNDLYGIEFVHDFPNKNSPFDDLENVKDKYNRRLMRLYSSMASNEKLLIVYISKHEILDDAEIKSLCEEFIEKFGKNIYFMVLENDASKC